MRAQIKVKVTLVNAPFMAFDQKSNPLTTLSSRDIEMTEDGIPQKIAFFARPPDSPLSITILAGFFKSV